MQLQYLVAIFFVALAAAEEVSNVQPEPVVGQQPGQVAPAIAVVHSAAEPHAHAHHDHAHHAHHDHAHHDHHDHSHHAGDHVDHVHQPAVANGVYPVGGEHQHYHYAPTGLIQVVGGAPPAGPQQYGNAAEQYGKPESASIPPNYKPFGSWGLYIGGNPADGYYTNYYKALSSTVDKQQVSGAVAPAEQAVKPVGTSPAGISQASAFAGPLLKQYPFTTGGYNADQVYPFDYYTQADLNSGSRLAVVDQSGPSVYAAGPLSSPVQVGSQVYGVPALAAGYGQEHPLLSYSESYSTKRTGPLAGSKGPERVQPVQQQQQQQHQVEVAPGKGGYHQQQQQVHYAQSPVQVAAPVKQQQHQQQQAHHYAGQPQVVAYPVPVGSQIVGSQPGTEGAYGPYGVHGYTRYAVKPTVVASSEHYYHQGVHSAPVAHFPVYKQQQQQHVYQPLGFYGYPLNQLHYSQGSIVPAFGQPSSASAPSPVAGVQQPSGVVPPPPAQAGPVPVGPQAVNEPQPVGPQVGGGPLNAPAAPQVEAASSDKSETQALGGAGDSKPKEQTRA